MLYTGESARKRGGETKNSLIRDIKKEIFDDNKFHPQKHGSLANMGVEQVQKIHSTVKITRNKNHACAERHRRRCSAFFMCLFVIKTVPQQPKSNPHSCCEPLLGLQWRDTLVHRQNPWF